MRKDEDGNVCPETLGEYFDLVKAMVGGDNDACRFLQDKIDLSPNGREEKVLVPDSQMRMLLIPMMVS